MEEQGNLFNPTALEGKRAKKSKRKEIKASEVDLTNYTVEKYGKLEVYIPIDTNLELSPRITLEATRRASLAYQNSITNQSQPVESLIKFGKKPDRSEEKVVEAVTDGQQAPASTKDAPSLDNSKPGLNVEKRDGSFFDNAGTTVKRKKKRTTDVSELGKLFSNSTKATTESRAAKQQTETTPVGELTYEDMLAMIFKILNKKREDTDNVRTLTVEPQVDYQGVKKTLLLNFEDICSQMHRAMDHVLAYLSSELRQQTTMDQDNNLSFKARISAGQFRTVLKAYVHEYVQCHACSSYNTLLSRDGRMYMVQCEDCSASRTVPAISRFSDE